MSRVTPTSLGHRQPWLRFRATAIVAMVILVELAVSWTATAQETATDFFVANLTVAADSATGWPTTTAGFAQLTEVTTQTVRAYLRVSSADDVVAFFIAGSAGIAVVQISVAPADSASSLSVHQSLQEVTGTRAGSENLLSSLLTAARGVIGTTLAPLTFSEGVVTMPCRTAFAYNFISACAPSVLPRSVIRVTIYSNSTSASVANGLCVHVAAVDCATYVTTQTTGNIVEAAVAGLPNTLEIVLMFTGDVRSAIFPIASSISLVSSDGRHSSVIYSANELNPNGVSPYLHPQCEFYHGLWGFAILFVIPVVLVAMRYSWYRARHRSKRYERRRIEEDERRMIQMYSPRAQGANDDARNTVGRVATTEIQSGTQYGGPQQVLAAQDGEYYYTGAGDPAEDGGQGGDEEVQGSYFADVNNEYDGVEGDPDMAEYSAPAEAFSYDAAAAALDEHAEGGDPQVVLEEDGNYYYYSDVVAGGNGEPS